MMKRFLTIFGILILLTATITIAKPSDFDGNGDVSTTVNDNGFDENGYNWNGNIFSGSADKWSGSADDHLIVKWNDAFDPTLSTSENQAEGAWYNMVLRKADHSVYRDKYECGGDVTNYQGVWSNCYITQSNHFDIVVQ